MFESGNWIAKDFPESFAEANDMFSSTIFSASITSAFKAPSLAVSCSGADGPGFKNGVWLEYVLCDCVWVAVSACCLTCVIPAFPIKKGFDVMQMHQLTQKGSPNTGCTQEKNSSEPSVHQFVCRHISSRKDKTWFCNFFLLTFVLFWKKIK